MISYSAMPVLAEYARRAPMIVTDKTVLRSPSTESVEHVDGLDLARRDPDELVAAPPW